MTRRRALVALALVAGIAGLAWYLYDPPWIASVTSGLREWEEDPPGTRFRWTAGRASFFVPSSAPEMTLSMRAVFRSPNGSPVTVSMRVDDRWLADIVLKDVSAWTETTVPLPRRKTGRSYRRVELRVSRTAGPYNLGVQLGEPRY
jgi:hypothetical protein